MAIVLFSHVLILLEHGVKLSHFHSSGQERLVIKKVIKRVISSAMTGADRESLKRRGEMP